jgi:uncharacterized membrane protein YraQ (UPF0718 family)
MKKEWTILAGLVAIFALAYFLNFRDPKIQDAIMEAFYMLQWYARNHTLACVVPAMFIAGAIATFLSKESVLRRLGPKANKFEAYTVASVSGTVLAVCSCSVLPMFAGIYRVGAGLGPASAFLYSGPAINVMAIFLTARVLGVEIGLARVIGAVAFAYLIGWLMAVAFREEEQSREKVIMQLPDPPAAKRGLGQTALYFASMLGFLVFSDWATPSKAVVPLKPDAVATAAKGTRLKLPEQVRLQAAVIETEGPQITVRLDKPIAGLPEKTAVQVAKTDLLGDSILDGNPHATLALASGAVLTTAEKAALRLPDNVRLIASVLQDTRTDMTLQLDQPAGSVQRQAKLVVPKKHIELGAIGEETPENYRWGAWVYGHRWYFAGVCAVALALMLLRWFGREELGQWMSETWGFAKLIVPLLFGGVFVTGFVGALLPEEQVAQWVGGNSFLANFVASVVGAMWYFATLTEIPILESLMGLGMGKGPALALLLAGPALSVPSIIVIYSVVGFRKTAVFVALVVVMSTVAGMAFGAFFG